MSSFNSYSSILLPAIWEPHGHSAHPPLLEFLLVGRHMLARTLSDFFFFSLLAQFQAIDYFSSRVHFTIAERFVFSCFLFAFVSFVPCVPVYPRVPRSPRHHFYVFSVPPGRWGDYSSSYNLRKCFSPEDQDLKTLLHSH